MSKAKSAKKTSKKPVAKKAPAKAPKKQPAKKASTKKSSPKQAAPLATMRVTHLIEELKRFPKDSEVALAIISKGKKKGDFTVTQYLVDALAPWEDEEGPAVWLIGGEEHDVDGFLQAMDSEDD